MGAQDGERAAPGDEEEPWHAMPGLMLDLLAAVVDQLESQLVA